MFSSTNLAHWLTLHGTITVVAVLVYVITAHVLHQRRHPTAAIAWVLFMMLAPYVALPSFLMFGSRKLARPRGHTALAGPSAFDDTRNPGSWAEQTARALGQPTPMGYAALQVHADGSAALTALWQTLDGARVSIDVCSFIVGRDAIGRAVIDRLVARARAGVRVRLMVDGLGHLMGGSPDFAPLRAAGAQVTLFVPPLRSPLKGRSNLRDHRKMLIADTGQANARLWCGGRNLASEYFFEGSTSDETWHDLSFDLQGALVEQAHRLFEHDWAFANRYRVAPDEAVKIDASAAPEGLQTANASAQIIASGPDQADDTVYALLITAAYRARRNIALATPYFVPDAALLQALCMAARRGVVVDLLLPARSNHRLSDIGRSRALRTLAAAGGRIWLAPQMMHAKLVVIDRDLALAGSANLDSRSLFINYELMVAFHDRTAVDGFAAWFDNERRAAAPCIPRQPGLLRDVGEGLVLWVGFQL